MFSEAMLLAVFLTGLLGGVHCAGMCGGIVGALSMLGEQVENVTDMRPATVPINWVSKMQFSPIDVPTVQVRNVASLWARALTPLYYNIGRISMYTALGILAGSAGSLSFFFDHALPIQQLAYFISSLLLIMIGAYLVGVRWVVTVLEALGQPFWRHIKPLATARLRQTGPLNFILTGAYWGLVPCGMLYGVLSIALFSGNAMRGGLLMLVFGLGTLPNLMLLGVAGNAMKRFTGRRWVRQLAGTSIVGFGVLGLFRINLVIETVNGVPLLRELCRVIN
ncbi:MAG: sulfite exporter TauE/SafE [Granulosicoccus sp.]|jgi:sulfite exporter TauE/SafE